MQIFVYHETRKYRFIKQTLNMIFIKSAVDMTRPIIVQYCMQNCMAVIRDVGTRMIVSTCFIMEQEL